MTEENENNAVGKTNNHLKGSGIELVNSTAEHIYRAMFFLWCLPYLPSRGDNCVRMAELERSKVEIFLLISLGNQINEIKRAHPFTENLTMMRFLSSIAGNHELREELNRLNGAVKNFNCLPSSTDHENILSRLSKIEENFNLSNMVRKTYFLKSLKKQENFASILKNFKKHEWHFYDLMNDEDFKQGYICTALNEEDKSFSEGFKKSMGSYIKSVDEGKNIASRHFEKNIAFQAYCEETDNANRALNVNLINYNGSEPMKISDILQQEKDIGKLNIYCNKKHDIFARREDKKRYYEFKEGACYQMTSTWPVEDESGNTSTCTMVMNVDSTGITKIVKFDGENFESPSKEFWELIEQNKELYIQGSLLHEAVKKFLEMQRNREEVIRIEEGEECNSASLPDGVPVTNSSEGNVGGNSPTTNGASIPTKANLRDNETQTETDLQQQKIDKLVQDNQEFRSKLGEVNSMMGGLMQNFEGLRDNEKCRNRLQNVRTVRLESKVEELGERVDKIFGGIGDKRKIKSFESRIKKLWGLLPEEDRSYGYIGRDCGYYNLRSSESSSSEESEGYESSKEVTRL